MGIKHSEPQPCPLRLSVLSPLYFLNKAPPWTFNFMLHYFMKPVTFWVVSSAADPVPIQMRDGKIQYNWEIGRCRGEIWWSHILKPTCPPSLPVSLSSLHSMLPCNTSVRTNKKNSPIVVSYLLNSSRLSLHSAKIKGKCHHTWMTGIYSRYPA